jgi:hypothetical protein
MEWQALRGFQATRGAVKNKAIRTIVAVLLQMVAAVRERQRCNEPRCILIFAIGNFAGTETAANIVRDDYTVFYGD